MEYPVVTSNMMGLSATPGNSKGKQLALSSEESDVECFSGLKELLIKPEGIYRRTRIRTETVSPINYNLLARRIEADDKHSAIVGSHSSNSYKETEAFTYMFDISEESQKIWGVS